MRPASPATPVESLEPRQLFSTTFALSFGGGGGGSVFDLNFGGGSVNFGLSSRPVTLPTQTIGLPSQLLDLPQAGTPVRGLPRFNVAPERDLRGNFRGVANVVGVGSTRLNVSIVRQSAGTITGTIRLPRLDASLSGSANVTFVGNRRFTFTFSRGSDTAVVTARLNKNGSLSGEVLGQLDTRRLDATFSVRRVTNIS